MPKKKQTIKLNDVVIGIDPGYARTGFGIIRLTNKNPEHIHHGVISTPADMELPARLAMIDQELHELIDKYQPKHLGIEKIYFSKNVKTAINVGQARGAILLTASKLGLNISEFNPNEVKQAITGSGDADKKQMQQMIKLLFQLKDVPKPDDAADGLAIALCCANHMNFS